MASTIPKTRSVVLTLSIIGVVVTGTIYGAGVKNRQQVKHETGAEDVPSSAVRMMHLEQRKEALLTKRKALEDKIKELHERIAAQKESDAKTATEEK